MKLKVKVDNNIYSLPLTKNPISASTVSTFNNELQFVESVISKDVPGKLTINNVTYSAYSVQNLVSKVPSSSGVAYSSIDDFGVHTTQTQTYTTIPLTFSKDEMSSLVDILKTLATYSHTHTKKDSYIKNIETSTTYDGQEYYCTNHNNNNNHVNKGNHCNDSGSW